MPWSQVVVKGIIHSKPLTRSQKEPETHPILLEILLLQPIPSRTPPTLTITPLMHQPLKKIRRPSIQLLRLTQPIKPQPPLNQMRRLPDQRKPFLQVIDEIDIPVFVCAVDERQLDGRAAVAAVEQDVQHAVAWERGHEVSVQRVAGDLAVALEVDLWCGGV